MNQDEHEAKLNTVFATLCKYCAHPWGIHAIKGCSHRDCRFGEVEDGCTSNGITAIRSMVNDPKFKYAYIPKPIEKELVQVKLQ